jgi:peptidoglycan/LPS O-acetylase OafA/YrhL
MKDRNVDLEAFDGIRGISSLFILVGHLFTFWVVDHRYVAFGLEYLSPVSLFFIISGFTLVQVYDSPGREKDPLQSWSDRKLFLKKRMARLAPVYYFSLAISTLPMVAYSTVTEILISVLLSLFMLQSVTMEANHWCGTLWTVSAFLFCYLAFPYMIKYARKSTPTNLVKMMKIPYMINLIICAALIVSVSYAGYAHFIFIFRLAPFWMGICGGYLARRGSFHDSSYWTDFYSSILLINLIVCAIVTEICDGDTVGYLGYSALAEYVLPMIQVYWLIHLSQPSCQSTTRRVLTHPILKFFGQISYSLYCIHWPVLIWCSWISAGSITPHHPEYKHAWLYFGVWTTPILTLICILFAIFTYWALEKPRYSRNK